MDTKYLARVYPECAPDAERPCGQAHRGLDLEYGDWPEKYATSWADS